MMRKRMKETKKRNKKVRKRMKRVRRKKKRNRNSSRLAALPITLAKLFESQVYFSKHSLSLFS